MMDIIGLCAKHVNGADRHFPGDQSGARLYSVSHCNRSDRNLVVCACGMDVLFTYDKEENQLSSVCETKRQIFNLPVNCHFGRIESGTIRKNGRRLVLRQRD